MPPNLCHSLQGELAGIFHSVLGDIFLSSSDPDFFYLGFKNLKGLFIPPAPPHKQIKYLICMGIYHPQLLDSVQVLRDNLMSRFKANIFRDVDVQFFFCLAYRARCYAEMFSTLSTRLT